MIISIKTRKIDMEDNSPKPPTGTNQSNYTQLNTDYKNPKLLLINTIKEILPNKQKIIQILSLMALTCVFLILASGNFSFINWGKNQQKLPMQNFTSSSVFNNDGQMATEDIYPLENKSQILESAILKQIKDNKRSFKYEMSGIIIPEFLSNNIYSLMFSSFPISSQG